MDPEGNIFKLWDIAAGRELHTFSGHTAYVASVAFSPDGKWALSGSIDKTLKLWKVLTGQSYYTFSAHDAIISVAFSPDGKWALSGGHYCVKLWDVFAVRELRIFRGHQNSVHSVAFSPDGKWALSSSSDETVKLWDVLTAEEICTFPGYTVPEGRNYKWPAAEYHVAFSPDGRHFFFNLVGSGHEEPPRG